MNTTEATGKFIWDLVLFDRFNGLKSNFIFKSGFTILDCIALIICIGGLAFVIVMFCKTFIKKENS